MKLHIRQRHINTALLCSAFFLSCLTACVNSIDSEPVFSLDAAGEYFAKLTLNFYKQDEKYYVQFNFNEVKSDSVLSSFARKTQNYFYQISASDMEKINNALNARPGQ